MQVFINSNKNLSIGGFIATPEALFTALFDISRLLCNHYLQVINMLVFSLQGPWSGSGGGECFLFFFPTSLIHEINTTLKIINDKKQTK